MNKTITIPNRIDTSYEVLLRKLKGKKTYTTAKSINPKANPFAEVFNSTELRSLRAYEEYLCAFESEKVSKVRRYACIQRIFMGKINCFPDIDITKINQRNISKLLLGIQRNPNGKADATLVGIKLSLRKYLTWRKYGNKTLQEIRVKGDRILVKMIPSTLSAKQQNKIDGNDIFTRKELRRIISSANNVRDKALLCLLIETGARVGEIINLKVKDVTYHLSPPMYILDLNGKTGHRQNSIQIHFKELNDWLEKHPLKYEDNFQEQPLWVYRDARNLQVQCMSYSAIYRLCKRLGERLGIKKPMNPHNFRHTFVTHKDQEGWSREDIGQWVGWSKNSRMFATYSHTTSAEVIEKKIGILGGKSKVYEADYVICANSECKHINSKAEATCWSCKSPLGVESKIEYQTVDSKFEELMRNMIKLIAEGEGHPDITNIRKFLPEEYKSDNFRGI